MSIERTAEDHNRFSEDMNRIAALPVMEPEDELALCQAERDALALSIEKATNWIQQGHPALAQNELVRALAELKPK